MIVPLPTFLLIGAHKAGTTTLHALLGDHPDIHLPALKEPHFFVPELSGGDRTWYEHLFDGAGARPHRGEASPGYTMFPLFGGVPARIAELLPTVRLVYLVRHPIDRMRSAYVQSAAEGLTVHASLAAELLWSQYHLATSQYMMQIERYLEHFEREQLLVLTTDELAADPTATVRRVLAHLDLAADWTPPNPGLHLNPSVGMKAMRRRYRPVHRRLMRHGWYGSGPGRRLRYSAFATRSFRPDETGVDPDLEDRLRVLLRPDLERLRSFLGPSFDAWGLLDEVEPR